MTILIDGFENWSGGLPVGWGGKTPAVTVSQSTSHVTQGTYSGYFLDTASTPFGTACNTTQYTLLAGYYYLDVYVVSGGVALGFGGFTGAEVASGGLGAQTLIVYYDPTTGANPNFIRIFDNEVSGNSEFYFDNLRGPLGETFYVTTKHFELDYPKSGTAPGDWYPPDWNTSDWFTGSSGAFLIRAFVDTAIPVTTPKHFNLNFKTPIFFVDQVLNSATKHFKLNKKTPILAVDQVLSIDDTEHFDLNITSGAVFLAGGIFIPQTKHFFLRPKQVAFNFELIRDYPVSLSLPFNYEILGVSVNSVEGEGRFAIVSNGNVLVQDLPFSPEVTNHVLSGIMVNKGDDLRVVVYMQNGYFRSFKTDFALKRI